VGDLVWAAIAPHGDLAIADAVAPEQRDLAKKTQAGMLGLRRRFWLTDPTAVVVLSPHNVHVEGHFAVVTSARASGYLEEGGKKLELAVPIDRELALSVLAELASMNLPALGVSYGGNDPQGAVFPLDWGSLVPLWYLGRRESGSLPTVIVAPARDRSAAEHVQAGAAVAAAIGGSSGRVALIASCDQSHVHAADGPYGFHKRAVEFDQLVVEAIQANDLGRLVDVDAGLLQDAKPDAWWQMLMLYGALNATRRHWQAELLSYEAPTYYGMLCAAFEPAASA
jgi:aromatic ring-opening dioxygenase LigB subunit